MIYTTLIFLLALVIVFYASESSLKKHQAMVMVFDSTESFLASFISYRQSSKLDEDIADSLRISRLGFFLSLILLILSSELKIVEGIVFAYSAALFLWVFASFQEPFSVSFKSASKIFAYFALVAVSPWIWVLAGKEYVPYSINELVVNLVAHYPVIEPYSSIYGVLAGISIFVILIGLFVSYTGLLVVKFPALILIFIFFSTKYLSIAINRYWFGAENFSLIAKLIVLLVGTYTVATRGIQLI